MRRRHRADGVVFGHEATPMAHALHPLPVHHPSLPTSKKELRRCLTSGTSFLRLSSNHAASPPIALDRCLRFTSSRHSITSPAELFLFLISLKISHLPLLLPNGNI